MSFFFFLLSSSAAASAMGHRRKEKQKMARHFNETISVRAPSLESGRLVATIRKAGGFFTRPTLDLAARTMSPTTASLAWAAEAEGRGAARAATDEGRRCFF